ncbi:MAG: TetR/AcrR family transcriptional regulator [Promethearchaeota archaeon]|nr:MAG: TetR/AcrR family transcriptional regulator [Candidatus Lokiarchaeota archaeon]
MKNPTEKSKKKRSRSKEDKAKQMENILEGCLKLIREKGFFGFEMRALAKHIGMSKANLYNYVSSKRELWIAVRIRTMREFKAGIENTAFSNGEDNSLEVLKKVGRFVFDFAAEDSNRWKLMTSTRPPDPPIKDGKPFIGEIEKGYKSSQVLDVIFKILQDGYSKGQIQNLDMKLVGFYLYSIVLGVTYLEYDILTDDIVRDSEFHEDLKFDKEKLRELAFSQMEMLLQKK